MTVRSSLRLACLGLSASLFAMACAADPAAPGGDDGLEQDESEMRASCTYPRRYFVTFREGSTCEPIDGRRGRWVPETDPVFADAPVEVARTTCVLAWRGERYARPDRDALVAKIGEKSAAAPACGAQSTSAVGVLQPIPHIDNWTMGGAVGCDVCGITKGGKIWVVLPPERILLGQVEVKLTNGETRAFQIQGQGKALSMSLPPAPQGAAYVDGRVSIY
jgi:hypothetical protein